MPIDWSKRKAIAIESDDWGNCAWTPDLATFTAVREHPAVRDYHERPGIRHWVHGTLETPDDLQRLFDFLYLYRGGDGRPVVMTPCYTTGNPDYERIAAGGFTEYLDISLEQGVPSRWERGDIVGKAREGIARGVWSPEFHARLHHAQPYLWLEAVRSGNEEAAFLFEHQVFQCAARRPEYEGMTASEQNAWCSEGIARMRRCFGRPPHCGVNSDASVETEHIWVMAGLRCRLAVSAIANTGPTSAPVNEMGAVNPASGLIHLNRNVHLEPLGSADLDHHNGARAAVLAVINCWQRGEPAVLSTHRKNFVSLDAHEELNGYDQFAWLLERLLAEHPDMVFLTSWEVAQLYRDGWSTEFFGDTVLVRNWSGQEQAVEFTLPPGKSARWAADIRTDSALPLDVAQTTARVFMPDGECVVQLG